MAGVLGSKKVGDIIKLVLRPGGRGLIVRIERVVGGKTVVLQEMDFDRAGRLRSLGEEGRFSGTVGEVRNAPIYRRRK